MINIIERIEELRKQRGWSIYQLALEAGITQSTIASMKQRNSPPKIETLQAICEAFGITLSQFFVEDENLEILSVEEKELIAKFRRLSPQRKSALLELLSK